MRRAEIRRGRRLCPLLTLCLAAVLLISAVPAKAAAAAYDVTFRPGSKGSFSEESVEEFKAARAKIGEKTGSITYKAEYKSQLVAAPEVIPDSGYRFVGWSPEIDETVTGKTEYVAKYAKLVNPIEYTVRYVDENGVEVAAPYVGMTEDGSATGELTTVYAKQVVDYAWDAYSKSQVITSEDNVITFVYTPTNRPVEIIEEIQEVEVPGETITREVTVDRPIAAPGEQTPGEGTPGEQTPGEQTPGGETSIPDESVPLSPSPGNDSSSQGGDSSTTNIGDESVPLNEGPGGDGKSGGSSTPLIVAGSVGGGAAVLAALWVLVFRKRHGIK